MKIKSRIIPAKPRSEELLYRYRYVGSSASIGGGGESSPGINAPTYWELITEDSEGNPLEEPYILTEYSAVSKKEIAAHGVGKGLPDDESTGGGYKRLDDWFTYDASKAGWVLSAKLGKDLLDKHGSLATELNDRFNELEGKEGDKYYEELVNMPSTTWEITHNLNKYPSVTIINNDMQEVIGDVKYTDLNTLTISFSAEFSGKVICN